MNDKLDEAELQAMRERNGVRQQKLDELQKRWADTWSSGDSITAMSKRAAELGDERNRIIWSMEMPPNWEDQLPPEKRMQVHSALKYADDLTSRMKAIGNTDPALFGQLNDELDRWLSSNQHLFEF